MPATLYWFPWISYWVATARGKEGQNTLWFSLTRSKYHIKSKLVTYITTLNDILRGFVFWNPWSVSSVLKVQNIYFSTYVTNISFNFMCCFLCIKSWQALINLLWTLLMSPTRGQKLALAWLIGSDSWVTTSSIFFYDNTSP